MQKILIFSLLLFFYSLSLTQDYDPKVIANSLKIEYGMHPEIIIELVKVYEEEGLQADKRKGAVKSLLEKYNNLEPKSKELTDSEKKALNVSKKHLSILNFNLFTRVSTTGDFSPAVYAPNGDVEIWYGIGENIFKKLWEKLEDQERDISYKSTLNKDLRRREARLQIRFEDQVIKYKELEKELASRENYDEIAKKAKELLENGDIDRAEKILEQDVLTVNKQAAYRNFELAKVKELNIKFEEATEYYENAFNLDKENGDYSLYLGNNLNRIGKYNESLKYLNLSLKAFSNNVEKLDTSKILTTYYSLSSVLIYKGDFKSALSVLNKGINLNDNFDFLMEVMMYNGVSQCYLWEGNIDSSIILNEKCLQILRNNTEHTLPIEATIQSSIGVAYSKLGKYDLALSSFNKALNIDERVFGKLYPSLGFRLNNIGEAYTGIGDYDSALKFLKQGIKTFKPFYKQNHPNYAYVYNNLGMVFLKKVDLDSSYYYFNKASKIITESIGDSHHIGFTIYNNFGTFYLEKGEVETAKSYYFKSLNFMKNKFGEKHPDIPPIYSNLGLIYSRDNNYDSALFYHTLAHSINRELYKDFHPKLSKDYNNLAHIYSEKDDYEKAIKYYEKAISICENYFGENHPDLALYYGNLGSVYINDFKFLEALDCYKKAEEILENNSRMDHPDIASLYLKLGYMFEAGNFEKALKYYEKALEIYKTTYGNTHPDVATAYTKLGNLYTINHDYKKAIEYLEYTLGLYEVIYFEEDEIRVDVALTYCLLADAYSKNKNHSLALYYLEEGIKVLEKKLSKKNADIFWAKKILVEALNRSGIDNANKGMLHNAHFQFKLSFSTSYENNDFSNLIISAANLGVTFLAYEEFDSALIYVNRGIYHANILDKKVYDEMKTLPDSTLADSVSMRNIKSLLHTQQLQNLKLIKAFSLCQLGEKKESKKVYEELEKEAIREKNNVLQEAIRADRKLCNL